MATTEWKGDAPHIAEQLTITILEALPGAIYEPFALPAGQVVRYTAGSSDKVITIAQQLERLLAATRIFATVTRTQQRITLTGPSSIPTGLASPAVISGSPQPASTVTRLQPGLLAIGQQSVITLPATTTGGTWSLTGDFGAGAETVSGLAWNVTPAALQTALEGLTTPSAGQLLVELGSSPRQYRITAAGPLAGLPIQWSATGSALTGNVTLLRQQVGSVGDHVCEVQALLLSDAINPWQLTWYQEPSGPWSGTPRIVNLSESSLTATQLRNALAQLLELPASEVSVSRYDLGESDPPRLYIVRLLGSARNKPWPILRVRFNPAEPGFRLEGCVRLQSATGGTQDEIQLSLTGGPLSDTATRQYLNLPGEGYIVRYIGDDGGQNFALAEDHIAIQDGAPPPNEAWAIGSDAQGGTLSITIDGETASGIAWNASAATLQSALEGLSSVGEDNVAVSGSGTLASPWRLEFVESLAQLDVPDPTVNSASLTGGAGISSSLVRAAVAGQNEIQRVALDRRVTGGTLRASFRGSVTAGIDWDASASDWQEALTALGTIGSGNLTAQGTPQQLLVEFGGALAAQPVDLLQLQQQTLETAPLSVLRVDVDQLALGPMHWSNPLNWTGGRVPHSGDTVLLQTGSGPIRYGLRQSTVAAIAEGADHWLAQAHDLQVGQVVHLELETGDYADALVDGDPVSIDADTPLTIVAVSGSRLQLALSAAGAPLSWDDAAVGRITVRLARLLCLGRIQVGLPRVRAGGQWESEPRALRIGFAESAEESPALLVATQASPLVIDAVTSPLRAQVFGTGSAGLELSVAHPTEARLDLLGGTVHLVGLSELDPSELRLIRCSGGEVLIHAAEYQTLLVHPPGQVTSVRTVHGVTAVEVQRH